MARFENTMGIDNIKFYPTIKRECPIGKTVCTYHIAIEIVPGKVIPDYIEMDNYIKELEKTPGTLEDTVGEVFDYVWDEYGVNALVVELNCNDAVHSPASVTKSRCRCQERTERAEEK